MKTDENKAFIKSYKAIKAKEVFEQRIAKGKQPIIEIDGYPFFVNMRLGVLQPKDDFSTMGIEISAFTMDPGTNNLLAYYNTQTTALTTINAGITSYPADVVLIEIPNPFLLDAVGMARAEGKADDKYYIQDGIRQKMYHRAKITPLEQTQVAQLIKSNQQKTAYPLKPAQRTMIRKSKLKGKGL